MTQITRNLKSGDKIRVIGNHCSHGYKNGTILTFSHFDNNKREIRIKESEYYLIDPDFEVLPKDNIGFWA